MTILFISNYFNHHQKPFCDTMHKVYGEGFIFLATNKMPEWRKSLGYSDLSTEYVHNIDYFDPRLIDNADVVIKGDAPYSLVENRLKSGKLTFIYSERIYKSFIPWHKLLIHSIINYLRYGRYDNVYLLCASAYVAYDYYLTHCFIHKSYKWGYFPNTIYYGSLDSIIASKSGNSHAPVSILWVGRTIPWKHPEAMIYLAKALRSDRVDFHIDMIGEGDLDEKLAMEIQRYGLGNFITLLGSMSPELVRSHMERSDIFVFTSDRNEGWGAVLNESMNSACAVVAGDKIGAVPYLIKDGENGLVFRDRDWQDLYRKVKFLIDNPEKRVAFSRSAYRTISDTWNASNAVNNLRHLIDSLICDNSISITDGPCSKANIIKG